MVGNIWMPMVGQALSSFQLIVSLPVRLVLYPIVQFRDIRALSVHKHRAIKWQHSPYFCDMLHPYHWGTGSPAMESDAIPRQDQPVLLPSWINGPPWTFCFLIKKLHRWSVMDKRSCTTWSRFLLVPTLRDLKLDFFSFKWFVKSYNSFSLCFCWFNGFEVLWCGEEYWLQLSLCSGWGKEELRKDWSSAGPSLGGSTNCWLYHFCPP